MVDAALCKLSCGVRQRVTRTAHFIAGEAATRVLRRTGRTPSPPWRLRCFGRGREEERLEGGKKKPSLSSAYP